MMSSLLSLFWSNNGSTSDEVTSSHASSPVASLETTSSDGFVLVDAPIAAEPAVCDHSLLLAEARSCRPYAHAHKMCRPYGHAHQSCRPYGQARNPPRLIPAAAAADATVADAHTDTASTNSKRSFADIIKSSDDSAASAAASGISYAQDASITVAEQVWAKIEQLQRIHDAADATVTVDQEDGSIESTLHSLQYDSPPLRPSNSALLDDAHSSWSLSVEPMTKRVKRVAATTGLKITTHSKARKPAIRKEKEMRRARGDKQRGM